MFESAELGQKVSKPQFAREAPRLREGLLEAQYAALEAKDASTVILVNGVDGAGKGETVNLLLEWLDPRHVGAHAAREYTDEERARPPLWRYWRDLPPRGKTAIFFGSWYTMPILERAWGRTKNGALDQAMDEIVRFERMLAGERVRVLKLWFHLSKAQQRARFEALTRDKATRWRVTEQDWESHARYDDFRAISERALRRTSTAEAPWHVIEGQDERFRSLTCARLVLDALRARTSADGATSARAVEAAPPDTAPAPTQGKRGRRAGDAAETPADDGARTLLASLDLSARVSDASYERRLEALSGRLHKLTREKRFRKRSVVAVFEGADAAGKGGAIRRVTAALDARLYRVIPIAAPSDEERLQPYLWRFWRHVPGRGRLALFDRSWYGRVLVERVEGYCGEADWQRAYGEINDFEEQLTEHGATVVKFWLQIDPAEQKRRFEARQKTGFKRFKITAEDWRNRAKWPSYEVAANEMFARTSTELAPWTLVAANDKRHARLVVLETLTARIEEALDAR